MKVKFIASYGWVGTHQEETMDLDEDLTEDEIDSLCWEWATERVDCNWEKV